MCTLSLKHKQPLGFLCGQLGVLIALPACGVLHRQRPIPRPAKERLDVYGPAGVFERLNQGGRRDQSRSVTSYMYWNSAAHRSGTSVYRDQTGICFATESTCQLKLGQEAEQAQWESTSKGDADLAFHLAERCQYKAHHKHSQHCQGNTRARTNQEQAARDGFCAERTKLWIFVCFASSLGFSCFWPCATMNEITA